MKDMLCLAAPIWLAALINMLCAAPVPTPPQIRDNAPLKLSGLRQIKLPAAQFGWTEFELDLRATYDNAFDPNQIDVRAEFVSPSGRDLRVPGFFYQDYQRSLAGNSEQLVPNGPPHWRVRYCPTEAGRHVVSVIARDSTGAVGVAGPLTFEVTPSDAPGFVRISPDDRRYFAFDDGSPYFAIGANVCWSWGRGTFDYDDWLAEYGKAGANYFRLWLGPAWTTFGLDRAGVGKIDLANAWRLDYVLDLAEKHGMYVMLCLDSFNELRKEEDGAYGFWNGTPHNKKNGGPLAEPIEFWTNETMLRYYRDKLRYLVARYGCRTHVLSWEFWNEVDIVSPSAWDTQLVKQWHAQMADYLREQDPYKHLITTSFARSTGIEEIDRLPQLDYVQTHSYGQRDIAAAMTSFHQMKAAYGKPHYVGELGTDAGGGEDKRDPEGICLHNGLWSQVVAGAAGTSMLWWWDNHIHRNNLYRQFAAVARFVDGVDFPKLRLRPLDTAKLAYVDPQPPRYVDLDFTQGIRVWQPHVANQPTEVTIDRQGNWQTAGQVSGLLHGLVNHKDKHNPLTFNLDLDRPTEVIVLVEGVSGYGGAHLVCKLDGQTVIDKDMPDPDGDAGHDTLNQYNGQYPIPVPPGRHTVLIENIGKDWIFVGYRIKGAKLLTEPPLRVMGLQNDSFAVIWVQNLGHTWYRVRVLNEPIVPIPPTHLTISGFRPGQYTVELWDTWAGAIIERQPVEPRGGVLSVRLPAIEKDVALKVVQQRP